MTSILCRYFVQNDPSEGDAGYPNLFVLSQRFAPDKPLRLRDVLSDFPLFADRQAHYHLRFATILPGSTSSPIWVDILNEEATVPLVAPGVVSIKVLRLPGEVSPKLKKPKQRPAPVPAPVPVAESEDLIREASEPAPSQPVKQPEFEVRPAEEKKATGGRVRLDSESAKAVFDFDFGGGNDPVKVETKEETKKPAAPTAETDTETKSAENGGSIIPPKRGPLPLKPLSVRIKELVLLVRIYSSRRIKCMNNGGRRRPTVRPVRRPTCCMRRRSG